MPARKKAKTTQSKKPPQKGHKSLVKSTMRIRTVEATVLDARVRELENELSDLRHELERSERRVEAMKQIGRVLGSNLELDPLLTEIVSRTTELLEADRSTLFLVDPDHRELWSSAWEKSAS